MISGLESCDMRVDERYNLDDMEMKCLQSMLGVSKIVRWRIEEVRCRVGVREKVNGRVDRYADFQVVCTCGP